MQTIVLTLGVLSCVLLIGCGGPKPQSENSSDLNQKSAGSLAEVGPANAGTVSGKITLSGEKPEMRTIDMSGTAACDKAHTTPQKSEEVVVNGNGTLKYVFVWVKSGISERSWPAPSSAAVLDQTGCMYEPHVIGAMINQDLKFNNSDSTNHNIHPMPRLNAEWNESESPKSSDVVKRFTKQEVMVPVKCNIHPWMRAYIGVVSHPFFAVTGDDGKFVIKGLPPGNYTLEAWQERYGKKDVDVTLGPKEDKSVDFEFGSK